MSRPDCLAPAACAAKGAGHCRRCCGVAAAARNGADPDHVRARSARFAVMNRDPAVRARQVASLKANPAAMRALRKCARAKLRAIDADPAVVARRKAGLRAAGPANAERAARRLAADAGLPLDLVPEYRLHRKTNRLTRAEAIHVLRSAYPGAFAAIDAARRADAIAACGPVPAIGDERRPRWLRSLAAARAGV